MSSRDGTVLQAITPMAQPVYKQVDVGLTNSMHRWESLLRFNVALFDLLSGLQFDVQNTAGSPQKGSASLATRNGAKLLTMHRPDLAFFKAQFDKVVSYAEIREDRMSEILVQMQPQVPFWSGVIHFHPAHSAKTLELIELALGFVSILCMRFKQAMAVPRPIDWSTDIQPVIATPSHSAYPSGHATEAYMIAYTLPSLVTKDAAVEAVYRQQLLLLAHRIAENRSVAGVHYPVDSYAGQCLAKVAAGYFLAHCGKAVTLNEEVLQPTNKHMNFDPNTWQSSNGPVVTLPGNFASTPLAWIAEQAAKEWQ